MIKKTCTTYKQSINFFENYLGIIKGSAPKTISTYKTDIKQYFEFNGSGNIKNANNYARCTNWLVDLKINKNMATSTIERKKNALIVYFDFLKQHKIIEINNIAKLKQNRLTKNKVKSTKTETFITGEEMDEIVLTAYKDTKNLNRERDASILALLRHTGARRETILNIKSKDLDLLYRKLKLRHNKTSTESKIYINDDLYYFLEGLLYLQYNRVMFNPDAYYFISNKGNRISNSAFSDMFKKYAQKSGVQENYDFPITSKVFRHSFVSEKLELGWNLVEITHYTGHKDLKTLKHTYAHLFKENLENKFDDWTSEKIEEMYTIHKKLTEEEQKK